MVFNRIIKRSCLAFLISLLFSPFLLDAQSYQASATIDSTNILIGDFLDVKLTVKVPEGKDVFIPQIDQAVLDDTGIEWINSSSFDTIRESGSVVLKQNIIVTSYDEGNYVFPSIPVFGLDSALLAHTDPIAFSVTTIPVDTTASFMDIKMPVKEPLKFKELLPYLLMTVAVMAIVALIVFIVLKYVKKKKPKGTHAPSKPKVKPDVAAIAALEKLRVSKLWQEGKVKLYYSELTEIIRTYIDGRFEINAMEMVSSEILQELNTQKVPEEAYNKIRDMLTVADLVKFAKWEPMPDDHDRCMKDAFAFVELTPEKSNQEPEKEKSQNS